MCVCVSVGGVGGGEGYEGTRGIRDLVRSFFGLEQFFSEALRPWKKSKMCYDPFTMHLQSSLFFSDSQLHFQSVNRSNPRVDHGVEVSCCLA